MKQLVKVERIRTRDNGLTWEWGVVGQKTGIVWYGGTDRFSACFAMRKQRHVYERLEEQEILEKEAEKEYLEELKELQSIGMELRQQERRLQ